MKQDIRLELSPPVLDFSQEVPFFYEQLRKQLLAVAGQPVALSDDDMDGLNAAGAYSVPLRQDETEK